MARLTTIKPRLANLGNRLQPNQPSTQQEAEAERLKRRDQEQPWRKWYYQKRWKVLRAEVLLRDNYTCRKTGVLCSGAYPAGNSAVVDHIRPHRGDPALFWDINNLETVSKAYHDSDKQRAERGALWS